MILIPLFVIVPLSGAFLTALLGRKKNNASFLLAVLSAAVLFSAAFFLVFIYKAPQSGVLHHNVGGWEAPVGITLVADGLARLMLLVVNLIGFLIIIFSLDYSRKFNGRWYFFSLLLLMIAGLNGVVVSGDLFNLFVFLEIASIASYCLVAFMTEGAELEAAFKYLVMSTVGSLFLLIGIALIYAFTSSLNLADIAVSLKSRPSDILIPVVSIFFIIGFGVKAALVPFHAWLADAHSSAPAPVSAMLSGVVIKTLGVYCLFRLLFNVLGMTFELSQALMVFAAISMILGSLLAINQWDFKRLLAYSSISQIGFIVLGISLATPLGIAAGLFHLFNHSIIKSLLFLTAGATENATGERDLQNLGGLRQKMPVTSNASLIGALSVSGIPPFNGFWSKFLIIIACVQAQRIGFALVAVVSSILTLSAMAKVQRYVFFGSLPERFRQVKEAPFFMRFSMLVLALLCVFGGLVLLAPFFKLLIEPARDSLLNSQAYYQLSKVLSK